MFKPVSNKVNFPELENQITAFWKANQIFEKSVNLRSEANKYVFYDGPPFITGTPHYGSLLPSIAKDVVPRYQTMKGKRCERVWGWDCHGLPIENKVEKALNIKNRRDIEKYGIQKFIDECYKYTRSTSAEWKWYVDKIGRWVDFENSYKTMDQDYMESVIWAFKQLFDKGKIYEGVRTSLYCTRCGTPVSNFEIAMDNSYADMEDPAVTIKFPVLSAGKFKGKSILAWTTTPWTLPSNKALVLDPKEDYVLVKVQKLDIELEKAWIVNELPKDLGKHKRVNITQAYITDYTDDSGLKVNNARIRKMDDKYTFTVKYFAGSESETGQQIEKTEEISKDRYVELIKTASCKVVKQRYYIALEGGLTAEVDVYQNNLAGLNIVEVEFPSLSKEKNFKKPEWFGKEVTDSLVCYPPYIADKTVVSLDAEIKDWQQPDHNYEEHALSEEVILAKKRVDYVLANMDYEIVATFKGAELEGLKYQPPFNYFEGTEKEHKVYSYEGMVTMDDGTGVVHSAPGFGDIDTEMGKHHGLGMAMSIDDAGKYFDIVADYKGLYVKDADKYIMADLTKRGILFKQERITHRYPFCYRCETPLLQKAQPSWFMDIQSQKDDLQKNNDNINWVPKHLKKGRFSKGIEMAPDWGISRTRFWASPMPIWQKVENGKVIERVVVGSRDEIRALATQPITKVEFVTEANVSGKFKSFSLGSEKHSLEFKKIADKLLSESAVAHLFEVNEGLLEAEFATVVASFKNELEKLLAKVVGDHIEVVTTAENIALMRNIVEGKTLKEAFGLKVESGKPVVMFFNGTGLFDLHRPKIDAITLKGKTGELTRVPEVLDVWMDSASMPYASKHYPFEDKHDFEANFPADFVIEYIAQTRAWFYVMHVLGTALFDKEPFKNVVTTGVIFGTDGRKMSKSYGNYPDPRLTLEKYGAEPLRLYLMGAPVMVGEDIALDEEALRVQTRDFLLPIWNCYSFLVTYSNVNDWKPAKDYVAAAKAVSGELDQWIMARLNETIKQVTTKFDKYNLPAVVKEYYAFVEDLSKWYIRRSRDRFAGKDFDAYTVLYYVLVDFAKLVAPIAPFITENLYQNLVVGQVLGAPESIHLCDYPEYDSKLATKSKHLLAEMDIIREAVTLGQSLRAQNSLKVRQPLAGMQIKPATEDFASADWMSELINDEINVKATKFVKEVSDKSGWVNATSAVSAMVVALDTNVTPELEREGLVREFMRVIQDLRKKSGLSIGELINLEVVVSDKAIVEMLKDESEQLKSSLSAKNIDMVEKLEDANKLTVNGSELLVKIIK